MTRNIFYCKDCCRDTAFTLKGTRESASFVSKSWTCDNCGRKATFVSNKRNRPADVQLTEDKP